MSIGPFHHYCKLAQPEPLILECLLYMTTEPTARLMGVEYFIDKALTRSSLRLDLWNEFYHDHEVEITTGRVTVLDRPEAEAQEIAEAAARTDGEIRWVLSHGIPGTAMAAFVPEILTDRKAWLLVLFLRELGADAQ
jgi:hypothetical protein